MEYGTTVGVPTWQDALRPCFGCNVPPAGLYVLGGAGPLGFPFRENLDADYETACAACELWVQVTRDALPTIVGALAFDKRSGSNRGRCLARPIGRARALGRRPLGAVGVATRRGGA